MDPFDAYYQQSDSKALLDQHGATLVADAREILGPHPEARLAGAIVLPDSRECQGPGKRDHLGIGQAGPLVASVGNARRQAKLASAP